jgi:hypothetical protein
MVLKKKSIPSKSTRIRTAVATPVQESPLRLYWIAFNIALEPDVRELLDHVQIKAYTRWEEVQGAGHSGPHLNDEVWPAVNGLIMFAAASQLERTLADGVIAIRKNFPGEGIKLIVQPCAAIY